MTKPHNKPQAGRYTRAARSASLLPNLILMQNLISYPNLITKPQAGRYATDGEKWGQIGGSLHQRGHVAGVTLPCIAAAAQIRHKPRLSSASSDAPNSQSPRGWRCTGATSKSVLIDSPQIKNTRPRVFYCLDVVHCCCISVFGMPLSPNNGSCFFCHCFGVQKTLPKVQRVLNHRSSRQRSIEYIVMGVPNTVYVDIMYSTGQVRASEVQ